MACGGSYSVVIVPLQNNLHSLDSLRFFLWLKRLRALEREKDLLWTGLQGLEQARLWYQHQLQENTLRQASVWSGNWEQVGGVFSCLLRSRMQRINGSLGSLMCDPCVWSGPAPEETEGSDTDLRWQNAALVQEVSQKNRQISLLELERDNLLQELDDLQYY
ncbi:suppressor APC domain-containing protein 1 [Chanos chanos]|uniref:Suppressor APC domain-containing protein 1 n=1 Tax=Chanos chanos TaxID=29144 RepID=A0A6J2VIG9_CHACN|nr:suppressor APC domain-containing protein 1 [Chanos chanos]